MPADQRLGTGIPPSHLTHPPRVVNPAIGGGCRVVAVFRGYCQRLRTDENTAAPATVVGVTPPEGLAAVDQAANVDSDG
jgi:DhnA family fructose-bisphosphate aldolase class Ia